MRKLLIDVIALFVDTVDMIKDMLLKAYNYIE